MRANTVLKILSSVGFLGALALFQTGCSGSSGDNVPGIHPSPQSQPAGPVTPDGNQKPLPGSLVSASVRIAPYLIPCTNQGEQLCLVSLDDKGQPAELIYGALNNFNFVWGHEYVLGLSLDQNGIASVGSIQSDLSRGPTSGPGMLVNSMFVQNTQGIQTSCQFKVGGQLSITASDANACTQLNAFLGNGQGFRLKVSATNTSMFQLQSVMAVPKVDWKELRFATSVTISGPIDSTAACQPGASAIQNTFAIENDGSFSFLVCDHHVSNVVGHLTADELSQLRISAMNALTASVYSIACLPGRTQGITQELYMTGTEGDVLSLQRTDFSGICLRGDQTRTEALTAMVSSLQAKYNTAHIGPAPQ